MYQIIFTQCLKWIFFQSVHGVASIYCFPNGGWDISSWVGDTNQIECFSVLALWKLQSCYKMDSEINLLMWGMVWVWLRPHIGYRSWACKMFSFWTRNVRVYKVFNIQVWALILNQCQFWHLQFYKKCFAIEYWKSVKKKVVVMTYGLRTSPIRGMQNFSASKLRGMIIKGGKVWVGAIVKFQAVANLYITRIMTNAALPSWIMVNNGMDLVGTTLKWMLESTMKRMLESTINPFNFETTSM